MRRLLGLMAAVSLASCTPPERVEPLLGSGDVTIFPSERTLDHAEDGVILGAGTLVVGDNKYGLVRLSEDGTKTPFGDFAAAGYIFDPANPLVSPNGVSLEPDGRHILVADITGGKIFRVDTITGTVSVAYEHGYGVNTAVSDSTGAIWFTQSTESTSDERMWAAVNRPMGDGAVFRLAPGAAQAEQMAGGFDYANGIAIDEKRDALYVAETLGDKVYAFPLDTSSGSLGERRVLAEIPTPDNIELDPLGRLWVISPGGNSIFLVDPGSGDQTVVFDPTPDEAAQALAEWNRRKAAGEPLMEALPQGAFTGMPGLLTGVILPQGEDGPLYFSGLGNALLRAETLD